MMKVKIYLFLFAVLLLSRNASLAQTTVSIRLSSNDNEAVLSSHPASINTPSPDYPSYEAVAWTWSGTPAVMRSIMEFNLSSIPANATITSAKLNLYNNPTSSENSGQHSSLSGAN